MSILQAVPQSTRSLLAQAFAVTLSSTICILASADDWPRWMGPTADGVYRETEITSTVPEEGLRIKWRTPIQGGYAGPAVVGDRVFVVDYEKREGKAFNSPNDRANLQGNERCHCLDAKTGKILWTDSYDCPYSISYPAGPRCTPTVDGDHVYTLGSEGDLRCLAMEDGKLIWSRSLKRDFKAEVPIWGFASHPLIVDDLIITMVGGDGQGVVAFDKTTGGVRWKSLDARAGYCPPSLIEAGGKQQLIVFHPEAIASLNPEDGKTYWSVPIKPVYDMSIARPQVDGDLMYASGIRTESVLLRLSKSEASVEELWRGKRDHSVFCSNSTPMMRNGVIFGTDLNEGSLMAVDTETGDRLWTTFQGTRPEEKRYIRHGTAFITRLGDSDRYLLFSETGDLIFATMTRDAYQETGRFHVLDPVGEAFGRGVVWSHPAYAQQTAFVRNDAEIVAVDLQQR